jgi:putative oxidoreductase
MNRDKAIQIAALLLRVVAGLLFMQHGGQKILDWFGGIPAEFGGHPPMWSQTWIGGVLELGGGLAVMLGLFTRFAAFIASGEMAVAYFQFHYKPDKFWPIENGGAPATLFAFIFLFFAAFGGGPWSLDTLFWGKRSSASIEGGQP